MPALARTNPDRDKPVLLPIAQDRPREALRAERKSVAALAAEPGISRKHLSNRPHDARRVSCPRLTPATPAPRRPRARPPPRPGTARLLRERIRGSSWPPVVPPPTGAPAGSRSKTPPRAAKPTQALAPSPSPLWTRSRIR